MMVSLPLPAGGYTRLDPKEAARYAVEQYGLDGVYEVEISGLQEAFVEYWREVNRLTEALQEDLGYTVDERQFTEAQVLLINVWAQLREPGPGDYTIGSGSQVPTHVRVDAENHITRGEHV